MAQITLKGNPIHTSGELPKVGAAAPGVRRPAASGPLNDATISPLRALPSRYRLRRYASQTDICGASRLDPSRGARILGQAPRADSFHLERLC